MQKPKTIQRPHLPNLTPPLSRSFIRLTKRSLATCRHFLGTFCCCVGGVIYAVGQMRLLKLIR
jgi:hypothetical protein